MFIQQQPAPVIQCVCFDAFPAYLATFPWTCIILGMKTDNTYDGSIICALAELASVFLKITLLYNQIAKSIIDAIKCILCTVRAMKQ